MNSLYHNLYRFVVGALILSIPTIGNCQSISKEMAIKLAEDFVKDGGYTNAPVDTSKRKLLYDVNEIVAIQVGRYTIDSVIKHRRNTLYPQAFYISHSGDEWDVGFLDISVDITKLDSAAWHSDLSGAGVRVTNDGMKIKMEHKVPSFSIWEKL